VRGDTGRGREWVYVLCSVGVQFEMSLNLWGFPSSLSS
jgi:hypothetical protein